MFCILCSILLYCHLDKLERWTNSALDDEQCTRITVPILSIKLWPPTTVERLNVVRRPVVTPVAHRSTLLIVVVLLLLLLLADFIVVAVMGTDKLPFLQWLYPYDDYGRFVVRVLSVHVSCQNVIQWLHCLPAASVVSASFVEAFRHHLKTFPCSSDQSAVCTSVDLAVVLFIYGTVKSYWLIDWCCDSGDFF